MSSQIDVQHLHFTYRRDGQSHHALRGVNLEIKRGELVAISGPSGSGKSTLLYVLGCLIRPERGCIKMFGRDLAELSDLELAKFRSDGIGFVFQQFHLVPKLTVAQNIILPHSYPMEIRSKSDPNERLMELTRRLGISELMSKYPNQLSGGQQQRVAIARALFRNPEVILADEPTGNLDTVNAEAVIGELLKLHAEGKTVVIITHDRDLAQRCNRIIQIRDGVVAGDVSAIPPIANSKKEETAQERSRFSYSDGLRTIGLASMVFRALPEAVSSVFANRWRSALTMVGVVIGVAAVLSLLTIGSFARERILESYEALGVNKLSVYGYRNWRMKASDKSPVVFQAFDMNRDVLPLYRIFDDITLVAPELRNYNMELSWGGSKMSGADVFGSSPEWFTIRNLNIAKGRALSPHDIAASSPSCVVGTEVEKELFAGRNPIGQVIYLSDNNQVYHCTVRGILSPIKFNDPERSPNKIVVLPYTYLQKVTYGWYRELQNLALQVRLGADIAALGEQVQGLFRHRYGSSGEFRVESDDILVAQMKRFLTIFTGLLGCIGLVSLLVGGIGITNMMLVSVAERYRELGLRKALGATNRSLWLQTLLESLVVCGIAGLIGLVVGFAGYEGAIYAGSKFIDKFKFEWVVDWNSLLIATISIFCVGIASGVIPAIRARKLQVIDAMRSE